MGKITIEAGKTTKFTWAVHPSVIMGALLNDPHEKVSVEDWGVKTVADFVKLLIGRVDDQDYSLISQEFS